MLKQAPVRLRWDHKATLKVLSDGFIAVYCPKINTEPWAKKIEISFQDCVIKREIAKPDAYHRLNLDASIKMVLIVLELLPRFPWDYFLLEDGSLCKEDFQVVCLITIRFFDVLFYVI